MLNSLQLTLFGSPEVRLNGNPVTAFRSSKAQALLYYLAVTGRSHTRATLTGLFWGDQPEAARASLSKCLSNLRDLVGDALLVERQAVAFNRDHPYQLDTERFMADVGQPLTLETISSLQTTLALYRGDFLEGFYVREAPDFEQWVLVQRAHYREAVVNGFHALANFHDQQGDLPQAIIHTRRLLTLEPWREEAHRQLMTRLARSGQRAAALAQFETCRRVLDEELAVEPDAATIALVEAIRVGEFDKENGRRDHPVTPPGQALSPIPHVTTTLPSPPTPLIGRERELAELGEMISNPRCRLITITGQGGIGKTRLALATAADQSAQFQAGAVFVSLAEVSAAQFLPQSILAAMNVPLQGQLSPQQQLCAALYNQNLLLVLDNYEHLVPDIELLLDILHHAPGITLLVTSRERLALQAEHLFELTGLDYPHHQSTSMRANSSSELTSYPAIQLFLQRVYQTQRHFTPNLDEMNAIVRICRVAEGMPLTLELAAGALRLQSPSVVAAALEDGRQLPALHVRALTPRHASLSSVFEHSWQLLSAVEQQMLRQVAIFRGYFQAEAVQAVVGLADMATMDILATLVDKSLLRFQPATGYDMHELVRQCALNRLQEAGEQNDVQQRHLNYCIALVEQANQFLFTADRLVWLNRLHVAYSDLRAAVSRALHPVKSLLPILPDSDEAQRTIGGIQLCNALFRFWTWRSAFTEGYDWCTLALERFALLSSDQQAFALSARLHFNIGTYAAYLQRGDEATVHAQNALTLFRSLDDSIGIGDCLLSLGIYAFDRYEIESARQLLQEAQTLFESQQYSYGLYYVNTILGEVQRYCGDYAAAQHSYQQALQIAESTSYTRGVAVVLINLAFVENRLGVLSVALITIQRSLQIFVELEDQHHIATCLLAVGCILSQATSPLMQTQAATLIGASDQLFATLNSAADTADLAEKAHYAELGCQQLGATHYESAYQSGRYLDLPQMLALARSCDLSGHPTKKPIRITRCHR